MDVYMMFYQKQCEVYSYFYTSYFILLMPNLEAEKSNETQEDKKESGRENLTGHESLGHLKGLTQAAHDMEMCKANKLAVRVTISVSAG